MSTTEDKKLRRKRRQGKEVETFTGLTPEQKKDVMEIDHNWKNLTFISRRGETVKLGDLLDDNDVFPFEVKRKGHTVNKYKISYEGVKRLAKAAGLATIGLDSVAQPTLDNKFLSRFVVSLGCFTEDATNKTFCIHGTSKEIMKIGEADEDNTSSIAKKYKGVIAEKRGFERGVIEHLSLPNIYGETEFSGDDEEKPREGAGTPNTAEFKLVRDEINELLAAKNDADLQNVANKLNDLAPKLKKPTMDYLVGLYNKQKEKINGK